MKLERDAITTLAGEGRCTLLVPDVLLFVPGYDESSVVYEDFPDDWFVVLTPAGAPVAGKENGYTYLSRKGYEANKDALKKAFESSEGIRGKTWADFEKHAEEHFDKVAKARASKLKMLRAKVADLEKVQL